MLRTFQPSLGIVLHLIIINALMYIGSFALLGQELWNPRTREIAELGRLKLAAFMPGSQYFEPYQIITHMFMHGNLMHLLFNMMALFFFGPAIEMVWGSRRFIFYYLFCGLGAYVIHLGVQWWELSAAGISPTDWDVPMLGASGAIFGVLVSFAWLFPNQIISLLFPPVSLKAKYFVPIIAVLELIYGVSGFSSGVAHFAHLGGALCGFLLIVIWYRRSFFK